MGQISFILSEGATGRATCQTCRQKIEKGAPSVILYHDYFGDRVQFHRGCILEALAGGLLAAGKSVVASWEHGDLAGAVRYLDSELAELTP